MSGDVGAISIAASFTIAIRLARRHWLVLLVSAIVFSLPGSLLQGAGDMGLLFDISVALNVESDPLTMFILSLLMAGMISLLASCIVYSLAIDAVDFRKQGATNPVRAILASILAFPNIALLYLMVTIAVLLASLLLVIPGIFLLIATFPAMAILAAERTVPYFAFGRAMNLTRGNRWRILAVLIVWTVLYLALSFLFDAALAASGFVGGSLRGYQIAVYVFWPLFYALGDVSLAVLGVSIYHQLTDADGDSSEIGATFD